jgi:dihydroorotate dehydrogenase
LVSIRSTGRTGSGLIASLRLLYSIARPFLFSLDPETAHVVVMRAMRRPWLAQHLAGSREAADERLAQTVFGMTFDNPLGLAAGLDKQGTAVRAWEALGFGAVEIGTVTPRPQPGNPRPRLFRLPDDTALINRFGFNSEGAAGVAHNLIEGGRPTRMRIGINIGKNKSTPNERAVEDYKAAFDTLYRHGDYFVINVSSPNTTGLRDLQQARQLGQLVAAVVGQAHRLETSATVPVLVKLSPDMTDADLFDSVDAAIEAGAAGIIATNTTLSRDGLQSPATKVAEEGGLSGRPLRSRANSLCRTLFAHVRGRVPIVGVGGIDSAEAAYERVRSGATLVQVYTALIYKGPSLAREMVRGLSRLLDRDRLGHLREVVGIDAH